jgi:hypothetical protein
MSGLIIFLIYIAVVLIGTIILGMIWDKLRHDQDELAVVILVLWPFALTLIPPCWLIYFIFKSLFTFGELLGEKISTAFKKVVRSASKY